MNICLGMAYDGTRYSGFQRQPQPHVRTIQATLEAALADLYQTPIKVVASGRTDKGVHAEGQIVGFPAPTKPPIPIHRVGDILNKKLPTDIRVLFSRQAPKNFHPRYTAEKRWYRYRFCRRLPEGRFALESLRYACEAKPNLNADTIKPYLKPLIGVHDFSSFCSVHDGSTSKVRHMYDITVHENDFFVEVDFLANAFLQHMVRSIVGMLIECLKKRRPASWVGEALERKDPSLAKERAPAKGLCLKRVFYAKPFQLTP